MKRAAITIPRRSSVVSRRDGLRARSRWLASLAILAILCSHAFSQDKKRKGDDHTRSVHGVVLGPNEKPVSGAVVQLKNTKTLEIRSFITQDNGNYYFHELSTDVDYELRADYKGAASPTKSLSSFDSRKEAILDLKLKSK